MSDDVTLDEGQLRLRGFSDITRVLDDSEERGVAGHWLNTSGTRLYSLARIRDAEELRDSCVDGIYRHPNADVFNASPRPRTPAIIVVDYRRILKTVAPEIAWKIGSARLCHPVIGRRPGSEGLERTLVVNALITLAAYAGEARPDSESALFDHLTARAKTAAIRMGPPWPDVILRKADLAYDVSRAKSPRAAGRLLDIYSLIHAGNVNGPINVGNAIGLVDLLIDAPTMRFDYRIVKLPSSG
jgi:hypothetical protein